ncbi:MerR family transcriptional regulator [Bacteroidia bacterium]|nr:MerR family transcriptional regulator [Bacteroidia bacterium]
MAMALKEGKLYYSISEVASHFDVAPSLLRYWETEFKTLKPKRNARGKRFYTPVDIETLQHIYLLVKEKGYTIQGAREKLKTNKRKVSADVQIISKLENMKTFLQKLRAEL